MRVKINMLDKELQKSGRLVKIFVHNSTERYFRKVNKKGAKFVAENSATGIIKGIRCDTKIITKRDATGTLRLCIYGAPDPAPNAVGLLWMHGGGFAMGIPENDFRFYNLFIETANCVIVSPDYTLSIQKPYPAALEDCYEALMWMKENAATLGVNPEQLFIGGNSAGGGLTAALTLLARDRGEVRPAFQMPLYPALDDRMATASMRHNNAPFWGCKGTKTAWRLYLGELYGSEQVPKYAAPARESDFSSLPPTYSFVGSVDPLCDETVAYIAALKSAGVEAQLDVYEGGYHAFEGVAPDTTISRRAVSRLAQVFAEAVVNCHAL